MGIERDFDLNLLKVFDAIMRHRSVSDASRDLGVTPSAVSHALGRLRRVLDDELFVSGEAGMRPTLRAHELHPAIFEGLQRIGIALNALSFDPSTSPRSFRVAMSDYAAAVVLPLMMKRILARAPGIRLSIFPENRVDVVQNIDEGNVVFAVGWFRDLPSRMRRATLLTDRETIVARPGHPLADLSPTREQLLSFPHVVVDLMGDGMIETSSFRMNRGVERRVWIERVLEEETSDATTRNRLAVLTVPHFSAVPALLEGTDMIATMPERLTRSEVERGKLRRLELPYEPLSVPVEVIWNARSDLDAGVQWLIGQMRAALTD